MLTQAINNGTTPQAGIQNVGMVTAWSGPNVKAEDCGQMTIGAMIHLSNDRFDYLLKYAGPDGYETWAQHGREIPAPRWAIGLGLE